mgnify:CR=1 FL=1
MRVLPLAAALAAALAATPLPSQDAPSGSFAVRCGTLHLGDGGPPMRDAWLVVVDGKIERVGKGAPPADLPVVDARDRVVMPGIVAVDSDLAGARDGDYQVAPDTLAVDAFDFERRWLEALAGGVTSAYLSPGRSRLVSGQGAVVKLAGRDLVARVLADAACLRVNFDEQALQAPRVFEPTAHPTDEDPLEPARIQLPTSRISVLAELRALFASATDADDSPGGQGPAQHRCDEDPLAAVVAGRLPLRAAAFEAADIRQALELQQELGLSLVLEDPQEIALVAARCAEQQAMATFRVPVKFGQSNPGGEDRLQDERQPHFDAPARAAAAGVVVGLAPAEGVPMRDYLMAAAIAVRHGLPAATALRAVGADAARILGVDDRVGTLAPGKDADFVVLSGPPLPVGTMVESTWIDGKRAYARDTDSSVLAVRAARVHDGTGRVLRDGVVVIQDGRIKAVGEELAIPYGATVYEVDGGVATPGFVDAFSHLGLAGEGTTVPQGQPGQRLHEAILPDDPMFSPAVAAGITTLLVAGKDGGLVSGRMAAVKTGADGRDGLVLREIAGQRMVYDAIGPDAIKPFAEQLERGKKYVEAWAKYEKDLAAWRAGKDEKPEEPEPAPPKEGEAPAVDPVNGTWEAEIDIQGRFQLRIALDLTRSGTKVTGQIRISFAGRDVPPQDIASGSFENGTLKLEFRGMGGTATLEARLEGDTMTGTLSLGPMGSQPINGTRTSKKPGAAPTRTASPKRGEDGEPKAPKVDENLEPLRAVLGGKAPLVVKVDRATAIKDVVALLEKEKVPFVLHGAEDLLDDGSLVGDGKPPVVVGPEVVVDDDGELVNVAATFAGHDLPVLFGSGDCAGSRFLPLHAAYAVRYGFSPADALSALTLWPARAFRLDDRIGSLEKGKDADLVVFSGNPFEPQSRVVLVVCNGRVVVDNREQAQ